MRVKNTFIDAWLDAGDGKLKSDPVIRSLPTDLHSIVVVALSAPEEQRAAPPRITIPDDGQSLEASESALQICSTPSPCTSPKLLDARKAPLLPEMQSPCEHVGAMVGEQSPCTSSGHSSVPVPSMPSVPPPVSPSNVAMLACGTEVEIEGLLRRPDFNGSSGIVQSWDPMLRRYDVLLDSSPGGVGQRVKLKRENLRLRPPPPPPLEAALPATTIDLDRCLPTQAVAGGQTGGGEASPVDTALLSPGMLADGSPWPQSACSNSEKDGASWYAWNCCDPAMAHHGWHDVAQVEDKLDTLSRMEHFSGSAPAWECNGGMSPVNDILSSSGMDSAAWLQQHPVCEVNLVPNSW